MTVILKKIYDALSKQLVELGNGRQDTVYYNFNPTCTHNITLYNVREFVK